MEGEDAERGRHRRVVGAGLASLTGVLVLLGWRPVWLWVVSRATPLALLAGIQMPAPVPTIGLPLADEPSWEHWAARLAGALVVLAVFAVRFPRSNGRRFGLWVWGATVLAVVAGCLVDAVLMGVLLSGGVVSELLLLGGTVVLGVVSGAIVGLPVALVCVIARRGRRRPGRTRAEAPGTRTSRRVSTGLLLVAVVIGVGLSGARSATTPQRVPPLTDDEGNSLTLRGFSTDGGAKGADGLPDITEAGVEQEYRDMGTNFVRLLISWQAVEPRPGEYDDGYLDEVAERVQWYGDRGYHVMLDMHQDLYGDAIIPGVGTGNGAPDWASHTDGLAVGRHDMWELYYLDPGVVRAFDNFWNTTGTHPELRAHYVDAWTAVAERFADDPTVVAYDLMNEPYGGSLQGPAFEAGPLTDLYQDAADEIRTVDDSTWLCLEPQAMGVNWGTPSGLGRVDDPREGPARIAFCPHLYPLPLDLGGGFTGTTRTLVEGTTDTWLGNTLRTAERLGDVPVVLGEFGLDTTLPGALDYVTAVYEMADEHGFGVAYWSRDPGTWGPYDEDGSPRNLVDVLDRPYPRSVSGTIRAINAQPDHLELAVDATGTRQAVVHLPSEFASGRQRPDVAVTGAEVTDWDRERRLLTVVVDPDADHLVIRADDPVHEDEGRR